MAGRLTTSNVERSAALIENGEEMAASAESRESEMLYENVFGERSSLVCTRSSTSRARARWQALSSVSGTRCIRNGRAARAHQRNSRTPQRARS